MRAEQPESRLARWGVAKTWLAIAGIQLLLIGIVLPIVGTDEAATIMVSQMSFLPLMVGTFGFPALGKKRAFALAALTLLLPFVFGAICGQAIGASVIVVLTLLLVPVFIAGRSAFLR